MLILLSSFVDTILEQTLFGSYNKMSPILSLYEVSDFVCIMCFLVCETRENIVIQSQRLWVASDCRYCYRQLFLLFTCWPKGTTRAEVTTKYQLFLSRNLHARNLFFHGYYDAR